MDKFLKDLEIGEIHSRDRWQFELKSEFFPLSKLEKNVYTQEFYLFIPNSFQINSETYPKEAFYSDQTNLIRFKTPEFTLQELVDPHQKRSPFNRIHALQSLPHTDETNALIEDEIKLLGNIVRSSLREHVASLIRQLGQIETPEPVRNFAKNVDNFCIDISNLRIAYKKLQEDLAQSWNGESLVSHLLYIDEFISTAINHYLIGFLGILRNNPHASELAIQDRTLSTILIEEKHHRETSHQEPLKIEEESPETEFIFYRSGLLNKYVVDALRLNINRSSIGKRFSNIIGAVSAGIAMLIYLILWVWQGTVFAINSEPFIIITVVLYILKDRLKEGLKTLSFRQASRWFPDYKTSIRSPEGKADLGTINESFSFIPEEKVPPDILKVRNKEFHTVLQHFKRPERVIYYKRIVTIRQPRKRMDPRRYSMNMIFRFNIHQFLAKLANPQQSYIMLDPVTHKFLRTHIPKVYHLNIIIKNTYRTKDLTTTSELKKFRLIIDKNGIKRVEQIH